MVNKELPRTIEEVGAEMATDKARRMRFGQEPGFRYIRTKNLDILELPRLTSGPVDLGRQSFQEDLRFHPETGEIHTSHWRDIETLHDPDTGKRSLVNPENYTFLPYGTKAPIPEDLPKMGNAVEYVLSGVWEGLEPAIRQQYHILENYNPEYLSSEPQNMRKILHWIDDTSGRFREGKIGSEKLDELSQEAAELITQSSLSNAIDETKKKLSSMLSKSTRFDSAGRINPMVSRIRLRSALLASTERIVVSELVRRKFTSNLEVLIAEREYTRYHLERASRELGYVQESMHPEATSEREKFAHDVEEITLSYLRRPRVAPYLLPSRMAVNFLTGIRQEKKDANRRVLGDQTAKDIYAFRPAAELLKSQNLEDYPIAQDRIRWAKSILDEALKLHEDIFPPAELKGAA